MIIILDKPAGMTSQRAVSEVRRLLPQREKAGHTGTLDPMCTGVLPVLTGADTRLADFFDKRKEYEAEFVLGIRTDTQDITGTVTEQIKVTCNEKDIIDVLPEFEGEKDQIPPMYSAVRVGGKHLYELARQGIEAERKARRVSIYSLHYTGKTGENTYSIRIECSAGTYIRTLCDDIGSRLGCGAAMSSLRRTRSNGFFIKDSHSLDILKKASEDGLMCEYSLKAQDVFSYLPLAVIPEEGLVYYLNGGTIALWRINNCPDAGQTVRAFDEDGNFLGLARSSEEGLKSAWLNR